MDFNYVNVRQSMQKQWYCPSIPFQSSIIFTNQRLLSRTSIEQ